MTQLRTRSLLPLLAAMFLLFVNTSLLAKTGRDTTSWFTSFDDTSLPAKPTRCEALAANPHDAQRRRGVAGVGLKKIDSGKAIPACASAVAASPQTPSLLYSYGRALNAAGRYAEALPYYIRASDAQYAAATLRVAHLISEGKGTKQDYANALSWYLKADQQGDIQAALYIADAYQNGLGTRPDASLAWQWANKGARANDPGALDKVGYLLINGIGVERNLRLGFQYYERAALLGYPQAMYNIATCYLGDDENCDIPRNFAKALKWARAGAEKGDADAMRLVGELYERGAGVPRDHQQALVWYRKAVAEGDDQAATRIAELNNPPAASYTQSDSTRNNCPQCDIYILDQLRAGRAVAWATEQAGRRMDEYKGW